MSLVDSANRAARKSEFYRKHSILTVPADKAPYNNILAMWRAGWRVCLVYESKRKKLYYCYKRRGFFPTIVARLLSIFE